MSTLKTMRRRPKPHARRKPARYVLWCDGLDFYVSERVGPKYDSELREHFVAFFARESDAWLEAEARTWDLVTTLETYIKRFRRERRSALIKQKQI